MPFRSLAALACGLLLTACSASRTSGSAAPLLEDARAFLTGSYDSAQQASVDTAYQNRYLHIEPIWTDRPEHYLYVELLPAADEWTPLQQSVYQLEAKGKKVIRRLYDLPDDPLRFFGGYREPDMFNAISPADLTERTGCAIVLKLDKSGVFRGHTRGKKCTTSWPGASYVTQRISVGERFIQVWQRYWNEKGEQVAGPTGGGYLYFKATPKEY